mgnify:CR=1 FL=1
MPTARIARIVGLMLAAPVAHASDSDFSMRPLLWVGQPVAGMPGVQVGSFVFGRGLSDAGEISAWVNLSGPGGGAGTMAAVRVTREGVVRPLHLSSFNLFEQLAYAGVFALYRTPAIGPSGHVAFLPFYESGSLRRSLFIAPPDGDAANLLPSPFVVPAAGGYELNVRHLLGVPGPGGEVNFLVSKSGVNEEAVIHRSAAGAFDAPFPGSPGGKLSVDQDPPSVAGNTTLRVQSLQSTTNELWRVGADGTAGFIAAPGTPIAGTGGATLRSPDRVAILRDQTVILRSQTVMQGVLGSMAYFAARGDGTISRVLGPGDPILNKPGWAIARVAVNREVGFTPDGRGISVATYNHPRHPASREAIVALDAAEPGQARILAEPGDPTADGRWVISQIYGTHQDEESYSQFAVSPTGFGLFRAILRDADNPTLTTHAYCLTDLNGGAPRVVLRTGQLIDGGDGLQRKVASLFGHGVYNAFSGSFANNAADFVVSIRYGDNTSGVYLITVPEPATAAALFAGLGAIRRRRRRA